MCHLNRMDRTVVFTYCGTRKVFSGKIKVDNKVHNKGYVINSLFIHKWYRYFVLLYCRPCIVILDSLKNGNEVVHPLHNKGYVINSLFIHQWYRYFVLLLFLGLAYLSSIH
jgi:hypothetical protein